MKFAKAIALILFLGLLSTAFAQFDAQITEMMGKVYSIIRIIGGACVLFGFVWYGIKAIGGDSSAIKMMLGSILVGILIFNAPAAISYFGGIEIDADIVTTK